MMSSPVRLIMLQEFENKENKAEIFKILNQYCFDWSKKFSLNKDISNVEEGTISPFQVIQDKKLMGKLLKNNFKEITELRGFQKKAMDELILKEHNVFVQNYTGSGKSLIFQLYALLHPGLTVVISPFVAITLGKLFYIFLILQ